MILSTRRHPTLRACLSALAVAAGISAAVRTQENRVKTIVAASSIEVDVRDARGNSVTGLSAADFLVTQNRERRPVISVEYLRPRMLPRPAGIPYAAPDIATNRDADTAGAVLFVLDDSTPTLAADGLRVIPLVTDAIGRVPTSERIGLFFASAAKLNVPFSQDRTRLIAAARQFRAKANPSSPANDLLEKPTPNRTPFGELDGSSETQYRNTLRAIRIAVDTLAAQPYRRKSLVLFSAGLPLPLGEEPRDSGLARDLIGERRTLIAAANDAGISINAVDIGGLRADFGSVRSLLGDAPAGGTGRLNREFLTSLARGTGGIAATGTNDPSSAIERMLDDAGSRYLVRFESDSTASREAASTIDVSTTRGTATIRRRGAVAVAASTTPMADALTRTTPGVPLDLAMIAVPMGEGRPSALIAIVKVDRSTKETAAPVEHKFTLVVSAYGAGGKPVASRTTHINTVLPPSEDDIQFEVVSRLDIAPGWYSVRAAIQTADDPKVGSVLGDIEIPSIGKRGTALSGVALTASPPLMSAPKTALAGLRLPTPTALRVFRPTDHLAAFAFVSSDRKAASAGVDVDFQILTDDGGRISGNRRHLTPDDLSAGIAQVTFPVDLTGLRPGGYWVTFQIVAADGTKLNRSSRIEVRD